MRDQFLRQSKNKKASPDRIEFAWGGCSERTGRFPPSPHRICRRLSPKSAYRNQFSLCAPTVRVAQTKSQNRSVRLISASRYKRKAIRMLGLKCNDSAPTGMSRAYSEGGATGVARMDAFCGRGGNLGRRRPRGLLHPCAPCNARGSHRRPALRVADRSWRVNLARAVFWVFRAVESA